MLEMQVHRDILSDCTVVKVLDSKKGQYVKDALYDEVYINTSFSQRAIKVAFLDRLAHQWHNMFGTEIEFVDGEEGVEWSVRYKNDGVQVPSEQEEGSIPHLDVVSTAETPRDVVRDSSD